MKRRDMVSRAGEGGTGRSQALTNMTLMNMAQTRRDSEVS